MLTRPALLTLLALAACTAPKSGETDTDTDTGTGTETGTSTEGHGSTDMSPTTGGGPGLDELIDAPCNFGVEDGGELALVTNDFANAGLARVSIADLAVGADVAPASTDTALAARGDWVVMVHRFGFNRIEVVDRAADWTVRGGVDVMHAGIPEPNPQGVAFADDGLAYVPLFGAPSVQIFDFAGEPDTWLQGAIDLTPFADDDGSPEAGVALACGKVLFVGVQRLVDFVPVDKSYLVALDLGAREAIDLDPAKEGAQGIELLGPYPKQIRRDPADAEGHTALVLTSGVERVDLVQGTSSWAVTPEVLAEAGIDGFDPQAFVVAADGASVFITATDGDFPNAAVFQVGLDGGVPASPTKHLTFSSGERMLERVGGDLWIGDANPAAPRLRVYDPATASESIADGLKTMVTPWTFILLP